MIDRIISGVSNGIPLAQCCRDEGITPVAFYNWRKDDENIALRFARAREVGFDVIAESCLEIADDARNDYMESLGADQQGDAWKLNGEHIQRSRLRVETRLKLLAKWDPKRYGDKMQHTGDGGGPISVNVYIPDNGRN